jgi:hypothetical protein
VVKNLESCLLFIILSAIQFVYCKGDEIEEYQIGSTSSMPGGDADKTQNVSRKT